VSESLGLGLSTPLSIFERAVTEGLTPVDADDFFLLSGSEIKAEEGTGAKKSLWSPNPVALA
jgi:hypothetical protein